MGRAKNSTLREWNETLKDREGRGNWGERDEDAKGRLQRQLKRNSLSPNKQQIYYFP